MERNEVNNFELIDSKKLLFLVYILYYDYPVHVIQ